jgi:hypothetical protein
MLEILERMVGKVDKGVQFQFCQLEVNREKLMKTQKELSKKFWEICGKMSSRERGGEMLQSAGIINSQQIHQKVFLAPRVSLVTPNLP